MTNFYFGVLLGKDVKKVTDTNDAEGKRKVQKKYRTPLILWGNFEKGGRDVYSNAFS